MPPTHLRVEPQRELHPRHGPHNPVTAAPRRRRPSVRRTTTHDSLRPDGLLGDVILEARGRDLATDADGKATVLSAAAVHAQIAYVPHRIVTRLSTEPEAHELATVVGQSASSGFRARVDDALGDRRWIHPLRYQLLDDLPTVLLVSGYAIGAGGAAFPRSGSDLKVLQHPDLCAGWAVGGTILNEMEELGYAPVVTGPPAPDLDGGDDPLAWHEGVAPLPPHGMRRRRCLDIWREEDLVLVECLFRDSHFDTAGCETVVHEYTVHATVDPDTMRFDDCTADVGALPWLECPAAAASAQRLAGTTLDDLRSRVRGSFVGPSTCTHLNDTLRSLEDVPRLLDALPR